MIPLALTRVPGGGRPIIDHYKASTLHHPLNGNLLQYVGREFHRSRFSRQWELLSAISATRTGFSRGTFAPPLPLESRKRVLEIADLQMTQNSGRHPKTKDHPHRLIAMREFDTWRQLQNMCAR